MWHHTYDTYEEEEEAEAAARSHGVSCYKFYEFTKYEIRMKKTDNNPTVVILMWHCH